MGIAIGILKVVGKLTIKLMLIGGVLYVEYRLSGGPAIRKTFKEIKDKRIKAEVEKAKKEGNIIVAEGCQVG